MARFRKKPVTIEAHQFGGSSTEVHAFQQWMAGNEFQPPQIATRDMRPLHIPTLEGTMTANPGDWVIKGVQGEFYPCKADIFAATYERVD